jgi:hypothetical protein
VPTQYDAGKTALDGLIEWADANAPEVGRNEAATRLHLIDVFLAEVLQWPRASIRPEEPAGGGRIDYALGIGRTDFIVEAKREGIYFQLPAGTNAGVHTIESLIAGASAKPLAEAMSQAAGYAASNGVAPVGVSNGRQLVVFLGVRMDGVPPLKGRTLVFPSLEDMRTDFRLLWDNLSPDGISQRNLYKTLRAVAVAPPEPLSAHLSRYPGHKRRNDLQAGLDILGELFLEDVARLEELREDFLRDCYATSGALSQYAQISKQILQTRYALLHEESGLQSLPVEGKKGLSKELSQDMLAAAVSQRPIILLGDVGVGKTTFIQRLVHVDAPEIFSEAFTIYIDFGSTTTLTRLDSFVVDECIRQLIDRYGIDIEESQFVEAVHHGSLNRFNRSVMGQLKEVDPQAYLRAKIEHLQHLVDDRPNHLKASLNHLRSNWRKQIVVFLDNIDQRSSEDQEEVFLISNELAVNWPATVFVTLRPETFYRSTRRGALSGYQARVFTVAPPRTDVMLQRRVDFALKQLKETGRLGSYPVGVTVDSESLTAFLEVLADNFRSNERVLSLVDNLAGGNMRLALQFVTAFIGSGHINTRKMLDAYRSSGRYTIAVHEFLRALLFGDGEYYDPDVSPIANLFRVSRPDGREHFLTPLVLAFAYSQGERREEEGFVASDEIYSFAQRLGFENDQIAEALEHAVAKRLLDAAPRYSGERRAYYFRITTVGAYTTRVLAAFFAYVDAVLVDTPIVDPRYRALFNDAHTLGERVERVELFRQYLNRQWQSISDEGLPWDWGQVSKRLGQDVRRVAPHAES